MKSGVRGNNSSDVKPSIQRKKRRVDTATSTSSIAAPSQEEIANQHSLFKETPAELLLAILQNLDNNALAQFSLVDTQCYMLARDPLLCRSALLKYFPIAIKQDMAAKHPWDLFREFYDRYETAVFHLLKLEAFKYLDISQKEIRAGMKGDMETILSIEDEQKKNILTALGFLCGNIAVLSEEEDFIFRGSEGEIAFLLNIALGDAQAIDRMLMNDAQYTDGINLPHKLSDFAMSDGLSLAARLGHVDCIKAIYKNNGIYVAFGITSAFLTACAENQLKAVKYLLAHSSDDIFGETLQEALCSAMRSSSQDLIEMLEQHIRDNFTLEQSEIILAQVRAQLDNDANFEQILESDIEHNFYYQSDEENASKFLL